MTTNEDYLELQYERIVPPVVKSEGIVVLFIHDALGSIAQWKQFPSNLCALLELSGVVYERKGYSQSSPPPIERTASYLHDYALIELPQFISHTFTEDQKIILVGHSDGGTIAMLYAHKYPDRIIGIVSMAAHVINEPETIKGVHETVIAYEQGKLEGLKKYHGENTPALFFAWADIWRSPLFKDWNISKEVGGSIPTLLLQGADDQYGTLRQLELIEEVNSNVISHLIPECNHHPHLEQGEIVLEKIQSWVQSTIT
jgi:pimeloyl-ACP methyl ester carboxylesterase